MTGPNESLLRELAFGEDWDINGLAELTGRAKALKANLDSLISSLDGKWEGEAATAGVTALRDQSERLARFAELTDQALAEITGMSTSYCVADGGANGVRSERAQTLLANLPPAQVPWWVATTVHSGTPVHYQGMEVTADNGALSTLSTRAKQQREEKAGVALGQMRTVIASLSSKLNRVDRELGAITAPPATSESGQRGSSTGGLPSIDGSATGWAGDLAGRGFGGDPGGVNAGWTGGTSTGTGGYLGYGPESGGGDYSFPSAGSGSGGSSRGDGASGYSPLPGHGGPYTSGDGSGVGRYPGDSPTYWQSTGVDSDSHGVTSSPGRGLLAGGGAGAALAAGSAGLRGGSGSGNGVLGAVFGRAGGAGAGLTPQGIGAGGIGRGGIAGAGGLAGPGTGANRPGVGAGGGIGSGLGAGRGGLSGASGATAPGSGGTGSGGSGSGGGGRPPGMVAGGMGGGNNTSATSRRRGLGMIAPRLEDSAEGGPASEVSRAGRRADGGDIIPGEHDYLGEHGYHDSASGE